MKYKNIALLLLFFSTTACSLPEHSWLGHKRLFLYGIPEGDDAFSQGFRDGCDTSLSSLGTGTLRLIKEKLNTETANRFITDPLYDKGFSTGSGYCANFLDYNSG